ncbi:ferritin [bacterium]|nr:MAG: ferritin [bacterium]
MLSERLLRAMNEQVAKEWYSAGLYKAMEAYCQQEEFPGFANWFKVQAQEELVHGEKFFRFISSVGDRAWVLGITEPRNDYSSLLEMAEYGLSHEKVVTASINNLMDIARQDNNHAAQIMLQWFITEQVEEESSFSLLVRKLKLVEGDGKGLLALDQELGARVFTPPAGFIV